MGTRAPTYWKGFCHDVNKPKRWSDKQRAHVLSVRRKQKRVLARHARRPSAMRALLRERAAPSAQAKSARAARL